MKKGTLTLKQMEEIYNEAKVYDTSSDMIIKWWMYPLLWFLPKHVVKEGSFEFTFKKWRGTLYLVKTKDFNP